jgi:hypothetical protein
MVPLDGDSASDTAPEPAAQPPSEPPPSEPDLSGLESWADMDMTSDSQVRKGLEPETREEG